MTAVDGRLHISSGEESELERSGKLATATMEATYAGKTTDSQMLFLRAWTVRLLAWGRPVGDVAPFRPGIRFMVGIVELIDNLEDFASRIGSARWFHITFGWCRRGC